MVFLPSVLAAKLLCSRFGLKSNVCGKHRQPAALRQRGRTVRHGAAQAPDVALTPGRPLAVAGSRAVLGQQDVEVSVTSPRRRDDEGSSMVHARDRAERKQTLGERGAGNTANE
jgi:hypothetical protein